jgi:hypothetical protein
VSAALGNYLQAVINRNGAVKAHGPSSIASGASQGLSAGMTFIVYLVANDTVGFVVNANAALSSTYADPTNNWGSFDYLGTG